MGVILGKDGRLLVMNAGVPSAIERTMEIQIIPIGEWKGKIQNGEVLQFKVDETKTAEMVKNFSALGRDLVIDYEHQTLSGDIAPAAGWIKRMINRGSQGLWAVVEWTDRALSFLNNKEYKFLSPVFTLQSLDPVTGQEAGAVLANAALTNDPFFSELKPIVSKSNDGTDENAGPTIFLTQEGRNMNKIIARLREIFKLANDAQEDTILAKLEEHLTSTNAVIAGKGKLVTILGLKAEATLDEIETAVVATKGNMTKLAEAVGLKADASFAEIQAAVVTAKSGSAEMPKIAARLQELEVKDVEREFNRIVDGAFVAGKILPVQKTDATWVAAQREFAAKDMKAFETFWGKQPVIGPVQKLPPSGESTIHAKGITEEDLMIAGKLGIDKATLEKHNKLVS